MVGFLFQNDHCSQKFLQNRMKLFENTSAFFIHIIKFFTKSEKFAGKLSRLFESSVTTALLSPIKLNYPRNYKYLFVKTNYQPSYYKPILLCRCVGYCCVHVPDDRFPDRFPRNSEPGTRLTRRRLLEIITYCSPVISCQLINYWDHGQIL
jgi:hypothetical protein